MSGKANRVNVRVIAAVFLLTGGIIASASWGTPEFRLHPVAADANVICLPGEGVCGSDEIILSSGGTTVTLFLQLDGWDPDGDGIPQLGGYQGAFDATTYQGGLLPDVAHTGHPGNPGTSVGCDIEPYGQSGSDICSRQVFISVKICTSNTADPIANADWLSDCGSDATICGSAPAGCIDRPDFVYSGLSYTPTVSCAGEDYMMGAASTDCGVDDDEFPYFYGGTSVVEVPECARGTYNVDLVCNPNFTLFNDCGSAHSWAPWHTPAQITIIPGATDCDGNGVPDQSELDTDGDGVIDVCDGCPYDPARIEPGICGCGVDDTADSDGDGVPDCIDECNGVDDAVFAPCDPDAIPTVSEWGIIVLTLLMLTVGKVLFTHRRAPG